MFMVNWFWSALGYLGLYNKKASILFLGLDAAGKTTLLHVLGRNKVVFHEPTRHGQADELVVDGVSFKTHDLGGHQAARKLWRTYFAAIDGIVFLVDSSDEKRFPECKEELSNLLGDDDLQKAKCPFLILGNKIDKPGAVSRDALINALGISPTGQKTKPDKDVQPVEVFMCSVIKRTGYIDGIKWLSTYL
jgi:GTP-binding protein SAR1